MTSPIAATFMRPPVTAPRISKAERRESQRAARTTTIPPPVASTSAPTKPLKAPEAAPLVVEAPNPLQLFLHLDLPSSSSSLSHSSKSSTMYIHPSIIKLALQYSEFKIVGANARCIAMLEAFKDVSQGLDQSNEN